MSNLVEELRAIHEELVSMAQVFDKPEIFKRLESLEAGPTR
jgi:hypothetical protein